VSLELLGVGNHRRDRWVLQAGRRARELHSLVAGFHAGLRRRSQWAIIREQPLLPLVDAAGGDGDGAGYVSGDLLLLSATNDDDDDEKDVNKKACAREDDDRVLAENTRTGVAVRVPADAVHILATLERPPAETVHVCVCFLLQNNGIQNFLLGKK
jgi:hypothetical protein